MNLLSLLRRPEVPPEPAPFKYAGQTGHTEADSGRVDLTWTWPEWTTADLDACAKGRHQSTRKPLVKGYISYFTRVDRWYCACGRFCWVWFEDGFADKYEDQPGQHERWVDGRLELDAFEAVR